MYETKKYENLKESATHGSLLFPLMFYHSAIPDAYANVPIHWHDEMEFTLIKEGEASYQINLSSYNVKEGDIILLAPHTLHGVNQIHKKKLISETFVFHLNLLGYGSFDSCSLNYLQPLYTHSIAIPFIISKDTPGYQDLLLCFKNLHSCYHNAAIAYELELKSILLHFMSIIYTKNIAKKTTLKNTNTEIMEKIKLVLQYIRDNYQETITVTQLAELCHFSDYYFMRFFKKHVGITCIQYINHVRLNKASEMLKESSYSVSDIALETGFNNISYFNRLFKETYHMTPREYQSSTSSFAPLF